MDNPLLLPQSDNLLLLPHTREQHPLRKKMRLMACKLSGQASCREMFLTKQPKSSLVDASLKEYKPYVQTWIKLCSEWKINPYDPPLTRVLDFLASLFERGLKYDAINTAKSAISAITESKHGLTLGSQPLISRFMKGVFRSRRPVPGYEATWDVQVVLSHLASFAPVNQLDLKSLTHKLVMLVALVSAQKMQSVHLLDLQLMKTGGLRFQHTLNRADLVTKTHHFS